jgi:hypothetical protein
MPGAAGMMNPAGGTFALLLADLPAESTSSNIAPPYPRLYPLSRSVNTPYKASNAFLGGI